MSLQIFGNLTAEQRQVINLLLLDMSLTQLTELILIVAYNLVDARRKAA